MKEDEEAKRELNFREIVSPYANRVKKRRYIMSATNIGRVDGRRLEGEEREGREIR